jgi:hypothetical protein
MATDLKKAMRDSRARCDEAKREQGLKRISVWIPAKAEKDVRNYLNMMNTIHGH